MPDFTWTAPAGVQALTPTGLVVTNAADLTTVKVAPAGTATGTMTATSSLSAAPRGNLTVSLAIRASSDAPTGPDPGPDPDPGGATDWKYAQIGTSPQVSITSINPTSTAYPGGRGPNELVLYRSPVTVTTTNPYGTEVAVNSSNVITAVYDRQASGSGTGTTVPSGGYVLSGHGTARDWLNTWATVSATVTLSVEANPNPTPGGGGGGGTTPTSGYPVKAISLYKMIWSGSESAPVGSLPSGCNVVRLAFAQGSPPSLVGYGPEGQSSMVNALAAWRNAGKKVILSIGGAGGAVNTGNRSAFMSGIASIKSTFEGVSGGGLDGIDWDVEASSLSQSDVVWISTQCKSTYGPNFAVTFVPNGGNVGQYLPTAVACYRAGALDEYGQQFYDANVSLSAAKGRISQALGAGLPQSVMSVGMMIQNGANWWTNAQCASYYADIRATWPGITKAYLWWAARAGTSQWVSDMVRING